MLKGRWHHKGVHVNTFTAPNAQEADDRRRIQITVRHQDVQMDMDEWASLVHYIRLVGTEPYAYEWLHRQWDKGLVRDGIMTCIELRQRGDNDD